MTLGNLVCLKKKKHIVLLFPEQFYLTLTLKKCSFLNSNNENMLHIPGQYEDSGRVRTE